MAEKVWHNAREVKPPEGVLVNVITDGGDKRQLVWHRNLWFLPDLSMYVYFEVSSWSEIEEDPAAELPLIRSRAERALRSYHQWADDPRGGTTTNEDLMATALKDFLEVTEKLEAALKTAQNRG